MLGLILSALYVAFCVFVSKESPEAGVIGALGFLWWWHIFWTGIKSLLPAFTFFAGIGALLFGSSAATRAGGAAAGLGATILLLVIFAITAALFLGGVYCVMEGSVADAPFSEWDMSYIIIGGILYGLGILGRMMGRMMNRSSSSSSD